MTEPLRLPLVRRWTVISAVLYAAILLVLLVFVGHKLQDRHKPRFADARDYVAGIRSFQAGADAYGVSPGSTPTGFIYPPAVLEVASAASRIIPHLRLWRMYIAALFASFLVTPWLLACLVRHSRWFTPPAAAALFVCEPSLFSYYSLLSGNISVLLYGPILAATVAGVITDVWSAFFIVVAVCCLVKLTFLPFLLVPILASRRQAIKVMVATAAVSAAYGLQRMFAPHLFAEFRQSLHVELIEHKDYGLGLFCLIYEHAHLRIAALQWTGSMVLHALLMSAAAAIFWRGRRLRERPDLAAICVPTLVVFAILANPRPLLYDLYIGFVLAVFVVVEWMRTTTSAKARWVTIALLAALETVVAIDDLDMCCTALMMAALLLVLVRMYAVRALPMAVPAAA